MFLKSQAVIGFKSRWDFGHFMVGNLISQNEDQAFHRWCCSGACISTFSFCQKLLPTVCCSQGSRLPLLLSHITGGSCHFSQQSFEAPTTTPSLTNLESSACMIKKKQNKKAAAGVPVSPCLTTSWGQRGNLTGPSLGDEMGARTSPPLVRLCVSLSFCL